jgi:hypothetical protein
MRISKTVVANILLFMVLGHITLRILEILLFKRPIFGLAYLLLVIPLVGFYLKMLYFLIIHRKRLDYTAFLLFLSFFSFGCFALFMQYNFHSELFDSLGRSSFEFTKMLFIVSMLWMLTGFAIVNAHIKKSNMIAIVILLMVSGLIVSNLSDSMLISYADLTKESESEFAINHLAISDYILFMLYFAYSISSGSTKSLIFFMTPIIMFSLGGRAAFFLGTCSIIMVEFLYNNLKMTFFQLLFTIGILIFLTTLFSKMFLNVGAERMLLVYGIAKDGSFIERTETFWVSIQELSNQVWYGDPGFLIRQFGSIGYYIHNGLSAWQFYGFGFFMVFVVAILVSIKRFWMNRQQVFHASFDVFKSLILVYGVLSIIFAKFIGFFFIWFSIGLWLGHSPDRITQSVCDSGYSGTTQKQRRQRLPKLGSIFE